MAVGGRLCLELVDGRAIVRVSGFTVENGTGWSVLPRLTLVVVDGPGDEGFLLRRMDPPGADHAPPGWDDAVDDHGGLWLVGDGGEDTFAPIVGSRLLHATQASFANTGADEYVDVPISSRRPSRA